MSRALIAIAIAALIPTTAEARSHCGPGGFYRPSIGICEWHGHHVARPSHRHFAARPRIIVRTILHTRVVVKTRTVVRTVVVHDKTPAAAPIAWANLSRPTFGVVK